MFQFLGKISIIVLVILFTPLAFVLCMAQLFDTPAMFSFGHIISFWLLILIFRFCLISNQKASVIVLGKLPK